MSPPHLGGPDPSPRVMCVCMLGSDEEHLRIWDTHPDRSRALGVESLVSLLCSYPSRGRQEGKARAGD